MSKAILANKYAQATATAFATGLVTAIIAYLGIITDHMDTPHVVKIVGLAFMAPFSALIALLPRLVDILTPTVRIVSSLPITSAAPIAQAEQEIVTTAPETVVAVAPPDLPRPEQSSVHVAAAVQHAPRKPPRVIPPTPPVG